MGCSWLLASVEAKTLLVELFITFSVWHLVNDIHPMRGPSVVLAQGRVLCREIDNERFCPDHWSTLNSTAQINVAVCVVWSKKTIFYPAFISITIPLHQPSGTAPAGIIGKICLKSWGFIETSTACYAEMSLGSFSACSTRSTDLNISLPDFRLVTFFLKQTQKQTVVQYNANTRQVPKVWRDWE